MAEMTTDSPDQVLAKNEKLIGLHSRLVDELEAAEEAAEYGLAEEESDDFSEGLASDTGYGFAAANLGQVENRLSEVRTQIDVLYAESKDVIHLAALKENAEREANKP